MANTKFYYDFHYPLPVVELVLSLLGRRHGVSVTPQAAPATREWFSQTRNSKSTVTEVITTTFRLPLSVSEISVDILRMPCKLEVWYQDRSNAWKPLLNTQRSPITATVGRSDTKSWYTHQVKSYPVVAKQVQFRLTRTPDPELYDIPYPVGLRNVLIRRNVYDRSQGGSFEEHVDIMGNVVSRYIKDWDAAKAADDNYTTYWKSSPQPDPAAVVSLYLDVRSETGGPQVVDKVYIDPVYSDQHLNLYYSSDDTTGQRRLSPISIPPSAVSNMEWTPAVGLTDLLTDADQSAYQIPFAIGPQTRQAGWIGVEWKPSFGSSGANLAQNPTLFTVSGPATSGLFSPTLYYDPETTKFGLEFFDGFTVRVYDTDPIDIQWANDETVRVIAGWSYDPDRVWIKVVNQQGAILTEMDAAPSTLPTRTSFDGVVQVSNIRGTISNLIVKLEDPAGNGPAFLADPDAYCDPDPVIPDDNGRIPSTSLDNAILAAPWNIREWACGGADQSHYESKVWTPVWRDYVTRKGFLHLPRPASMKFLKLEFTNLTEEAYPIYEAGVETRYKVFPATVTQQSSLGPKIYSGQGGFLGLGTFISANGVRSVNWLDPRSVMQAVSGVFGTQTPPVIINPGTPYITTSMPNNGAQLLESSKRIEAGSRYVYARDAMQPYVLAQDAYTTTIKAEGLQAVQPYVDVPWPEIEKANPGAVTKVRSTGTVPIRGTDWWIYPGQQLKVPASVMTRMTSGSVVTERKLTLEKRVRFSTVSVHRYDYRTIKRDAALAYFAGIREVQPYTSSYISSEDRPEWDFPIYDPSQWTLDPHVTQLTDLKTGEFLGPIGVSLPGAGTAMKTLTTQSGFSRLTLDYRDSGLMRSNSLWAGGIDPDRLSPYVSILPTSIPTGNWADITHTWSDTDTKWGSPFGVITANLNNERRFLGTRVLSFTRESDISSAGSEAGISLNQHVNFVPQALARMAVVYNKPVANGNTLRMRLARASDATVIYSETLTPEVGKWSTYETKFFEVPPTLTNGGFSVGTLTTWTPGGADTWTQDNTVGRTGTGSAKFVKSGATAQTIMTEKMLYFADNPLSFLTWVKWSGVTATGEDPVIKVRAVFTDINDDVVSTVDLTDQTVSSPTGASTDWAGNSGGWVPIGGTITSPSSGSTHVAFQIYVADTLTAGTIWVDDAAADVPGAARQTYNLELTVVGNSKDTMYLADLYTEIAPIRYFVQMGGEGAYITEVTDLRYTKTRTVVTAPVPVYETTLRTVVLSPKAWAFGCSVQPLYLR